MIECVSLIKENTFQMNAYCEREPSLDEVENVSVVSELTGK